MNEVETLKAELDLKTRALKSQLELRDAVKAMTHMGLQDWKERVVIIHDYLAPFARTDDHALKVAVYDPMWDVFLRFEDDPSWDVYGTDYETEEKAHEALKKCSPPRPARRMFRIKLNKVDDD